MNTNDKLIREKLDMFTSDLNGGLLQGTQAREFFQRAIKGNVLLPIIRTETVPEGGEHSMPRILFPNRILHAATEGQALPEAKRAVPVIDDIKLKTYEFIAHTRVTKKTLMRNIEQDRFKQTLMDIIGKAVGRDMEEIALNGDTTSADPDLKLFDGMRKLAGNTVDHSAVKFGSATMSEMIGVLPVQFLQKRDQMGFFPSGHSEEYYRQELAGRATGMGDANQANKLELMYSGSMVRGVPQMPENLSIPPNTTTEALLLNPDNAILGIEERIEMETFYDIRNRVLDIVTTVWFGFAYEEPEAVVRGYNLLA